MLLPTTMWWRGLCSPVNFTKAGDTSGPWGQAESLPHRCTPMAWQPSPAETVPFLPSWVQTSSQSSPLPCSPSPGHRLACWFKHSRHHAVSSDHWSKFEDESVYLKYILVVNVTKLPKTNKQQNTSRLYFQARHLIYLPLAKLKYC